MVGVGSGGDWMGVAGTTQGRVKMENSEEKGADRIYMARGGEAQVQNQSSIGSA